MPDDVDATRVGGDHAAERRRVPGRGVDSKFSLYLRGRALRGRERRPGLGHDEAFGGVAAEDVVQPTETQHGFAVSRHRATHETRVTALRNDRDTKAGADGEHLGDLAGIGRPYHHQ